MKRKLPFGLLVLTSIFVLQTTRASGSGSQGEHKWSEIPEASDEQSEPISALKSKSDEGVKNDAGKGSPLAPGKEKLEEISATVRLIRANPETEVFFKDYKQSLIIPKDSNHNQIYELCENSRKTGAPVRLSIDPKARRILSPSKPSGNTEDLSTH